MKILSVLGSFKDVYSPIESSELIKRIILEKDLGYEIEELPMCDGGEYTYEVLKYHMQCTEECALNVTSPYGTKRDARYLGIENEAYIISSEILRLYPEEDVYKNPLNLTDYGLGEMIEDALSKGYDKINLCLGGTSTIGYGMGTAQAMGVTFFDRTNKEIKEILTPKIYKEIHHVKVKKHYKYEKISFNIINDGITRACDLETVNPLKIGRTYEQQKDIILRDLNQAAENIFNLTGKSKETAYSGNGGCVYFGMQMLFSLQNYRGASYFSELFELEQKIMESDVVITGEGRCDNPHLKKLPV